MIKLFQQIFANWIFNQLKHRSYYAIILINLIPLVGVMLYHWSVLEMLLALVLEIGVMAFYSGLMILFLKDELVIFEKSWLFKLWFVPVFWIFFAAFLPGFAGVFYVALSPLRESFPFLFTRQVGLVLMIGYGVFFILRFKTNQNFYFDYFMQEPMVRLFYLVFLMGIGFGMAKLVGNNRGLLLGLIALKFMFDSRWYAGYQESLQKLFMRKTLPRKEKSRR